MFSSTPIACARPYNSAAASTRSTRRVQEKCASRVLVDAPILVTYVVCTMVRLRTDFLL